MICEIAFLPRRIFRLLQLAGFVLQAPLQESPEAVQSLAVMNSFIVLPVVNVLEALKGNFILHIVS